MKLLRARMRPYAAPGVVEALERAGFDAMTASEVQEHAGGSPGRYRGAALPSPPSMQVELALALHDDRVAQAIATLEACSQATANGGIAITVEPLVHAVRVRTGQVDEAAL